MPPKKNDQQHYYGFDSSGLEKAAAAAKYLDSSQNSKAAFDISLKKEETKQLELKESTEKLSMQKAQVVEEQKRQTIQYDQEMKKRQAEYQVQLELQRDRNKLQQKEEMRQQRRQADEESIQRQEQMKRQTLEYEYQLKASVKQQQLDQQKQHTEQLAAQKQAFDTDMMHQKASERRETQRQALVTGIGMVGQQMSSFFQNPKLVAKVAYSSLAIFGAFFGMRFAFQMLGMRMMARFGKPKLVRETSKLHTSNYLTLPFMWMQKRVMMSMKRSEKDLLAGVILEKHLQEQIREISYAVLNRRQHYAPCKNIMFYGPPGTGKTLFAKKLALQSGLEYAVMVGSDIAPLGKDAVTELNKLFDWAESQSNGMILFIDESDAFLRNRSNQEMSEDMRHSINSFLYRTGSPSDKVILVMATNTPNQLDSAVHDRIDEIVNFNKPTVNERQTMLYHYLVQYCQPPETQYEKLQFLYRYPRSIFTGKKLIRMEGVSHEVIENIAKVTEGFSGREIMKMVVAWHDAAFTTPELLLTPEMMERILKKFKLQHKLKDTWSRSEALLYEKMIDLDESMTGQQTSVNTTTANDQSEELLNQISNERLKLKDLREGASSSTDETSSSQEDEQKTKI